MEIEISLGSNIYITLRLLSSVVKKEILEKCLDDQEFFYMFITIEPIIRLQCKHLFSERL